MVARMQKMKSGNLGGAYKHNERIFENHSNKDIDTSRSHLNYELTDRDHSVSYERQIKDYVNANKVSNRAIRKDAVLCAEWIITSDKAFFEKLNQEQTRAFFETAKNYFAENYGKTNIAYASVHLDESTPHMHLGVVPFENGKLSSKAMFDREELKHIQEDLPRYMNRYGYGLQRGVEGSEAEHYSVAEYKRIIDEAEKVKTEMLKSAEEEVQHQSKKRDELAELNDSEAMRWQRNRKKVDDMLTWLNSHSQILEDQKAEISRNEQTISEQRSEIAQKGSEWAKFDSMVKSSQEELKALKSQIRASESYFEEKHQILETLQSNIADKSQHLEELEKNIELSEKVEQDLKKQVAFRLLQSRKQKVDYDTIYPDLEKFGIGDMFRKLHDILYSSEQKGVLRKFIEIPMSTVEILKKGFRNFQMIIKTQSDYIYDLRKQNEILRNENDWLNSKDNEQLDPLIKQEVTEVVKSTSLEEIIKMAQQEVKEVDMIPDKSVSHDLDL